MSKDRFPLNIGENALKSNIEAQVTTHTPKMAGIYLIQEFLKDVQHPDFEEDEFPVLLKKLNDDVESKCYISQLQIHSLMQEHLNINEADGGREIFCLQLCLYRLLHTPNETTNSSPAAK